MSVVRGRDPLDEVPEAPGPRLAADDARAFGADFGDDTRESGGDPRPQAGPSGAPTSLRIEVRDGGRQVVNLRLPIAVGRFALDRVPGLSGDQVDRVREAMNTGLAAPSSSWTTAAAGSGSSSSRLR